VDYIGRALRQRLARACPAKARWRGHGLARVVFLSFAFFYALGREADMPQSRYPKPSRHTRPGAPLRMATALRLPVDPGRRRLVCAGLCALVAGLGGRQSAVRAEAAPNPAGKPQPIGVIGAGHIGGTIGGLWVRAGHPVLFSSRHPDELRPLVEKLGPLARAGTVGQAIAFADVVLLAVPYKALPEIAKDHGAALAGKVLIDATNAFRERDGEPGAQALRDGIGITTARFFPGARVVRAFNFMGAASFASESHRRGEPVAVPIAGDDMQALRVAAQLVRDAGFEPVVVGGLASADSFAPGGPLFHQIGSAQAMRDRLGQASGPSGGPPR